jgi:hypothetical protein
MPAAIRVRLRPFGTRRCGGRVFRTFVFTIYVRRMPLGSAQVVLQTSGSPICSGKGDAKMFKKYSQMKLQMKREALAKLNRQANESGPGSGTVCRAARAGFWHSFGTLEAKTKRI